MSAICPGALDGDLCEYCGGCLTEEEEAEHLREIAASVKSIYFFRQITYNLN